MHNFVLLFSSVWSGAEHCLALSALAATPNYSFGVAEQRQEWKGRRDASIISEVQSNCGLFCVPVSKSQLDCLNAPGVEETWG